MLKSVLSNSLYSLISDVADRFSLALLFVLVIRGLGEPAAGVLTLSTNYVLLLSSVAFWGLDQLLIRDVAADRSRSLSYFWHFYLVRLAVSPALWLFLAALVLGFRPYMPSTNRFVALVGGMLVGDSVSSLGRALFVAWQRAWLSALLSVGTAVLRLGAGIVILALGQNIEWLALLLVVTSWVQAAAMTWLAARPLAPKSFRFDGPFCRQQIGASLPFIPIGLSMAIEAQFGSILLSLWWSEANVGAYGSANVIISALALLSQAIRIGIFPVMARLYQDDRARLTDLVARTWRYLAIISQPVVALVILFSDPIMALVYRYANPISVVTLRWLALALCFYFMNIPNARLMILDGRQAVMARLFGVSALVNVLLSFLLIPSQGAQGVAISRVISMGVLFVLNGIYVYRHVLPVQPWRLVWKPLLAGVALVVIALALPAGVSDLLRAALSVLMYLGLLVVLRTFSRGEWLWVRHKLAG
jgi:O-antigen/teichoic acid export membrane protein